MADLSSYPARLIPLDGGKIINATVGDCLDAYLAMDLDERAKQRMSIDGSFAWHDIEPAQIEEVAEMRVLGQWPPSDAAIAEFRART